ncbi:hypothetical protein EV176_004439 [Coemansia sp. RSA 451]|nr:hypothetical protein EV176_004439 [Coemansia sp. RSA 451]
MWASMQGTRDPHTDNVQSVESELSRLAAQLARCNVSVSHEVLRGAPSVCVPEYVHAHHGELAVVQSPTRSAVADMMAYAWTDVCVRTTKCPVLVVRPHELSDTVAQALDNIVGGMWVVHCRKYGCGVRSRANSRLESESPRADSARDICDSNSPTDNGLAVFNAHSVMHCTYLSYSEIEGVDRVGDCGAWPRMGVGAGTVVCGRIGTHNGTRLGCAGGAHLANEEVYVGAQLAHVFKEPG